MFTIEQEETSLKKEEDKNINFKIKTKICFMINPNTEYLEKNQ